MKKLLVLLVLGLSSCIEPDKGLIIENPSVLTKYKPTGMLVDENGYYVAMTYEINGYTVIASYKGGSSVIPKP